MTDTVTQSAQKIIDDAKAAKEARDKAVYDMIVENATELLYSLLLEHSSATVIGAFVTYTLDLERWIDAEADAAAKEREEYNG